MRPGSCRSPTCSPCGARPSIVLLGDPQQLDQPLQGSHPPGAERSALGHLLGDRDATIPDRGLFLEHTYRLHPDVSAYTPAAFYEGRLEPRPDLERSSVSAGTRRRHGAALLPAATTAADSESTRRRCIVELVRAARERLDVDRPPRRRAADDIADVLVVAPTTRRSARSRSAFRGARVGTVDKFQGQEAPISIYSMTSSSPEDAPRGMEFLYSLNRLTWRPRARAASRSWSPSPRSSASGRTPEQMRLANALCQFAEHAAAD